MKVVSLFDGISCGRVALERAGIPVSRYVAYEIDQNAINCSTWNYPDIEHRGTVVGADFSEFIGFDIVMGGFPCQDLSLAGKRKGLKGKRSSLFWYLAEAIEIIKPRYFLVENNVGMPKEAEDIITETLGVAPIAIDSALVSAQARKRLYWTNIPGVEQPTDKGIILKDILQKRHLKPYGGGRLMNSKAEPTHRVNKPFRVGNTSASNCRSTRVYSAMGKSITLTANAGGGAQTGLYLIDGGVYSLNEKGAALLQNLPEDYADMLNKTAACRAYGNGWTVDVIAHIFNYINVDMLI